MGLVFEASGSGTCWRKLCVVSSGLPCVLHGGSMPWYAIPVPLSYGGGHYCLAGMFVVMVVWWGNC